MFKNLKIFDNRILILYIISTTKDDLTLNNIASVCADFDDITYFDVYEYIQNLIFNGYIYTIVSQDYDGKEESYEIYKLTELGNSTLNELLELVPGVDLFKLKNIISEKFANSKSSVINMSVGSNIHPLNNDNFKVSCFIKDNGSNLMDIALYGSNTNETANIVKNWKKNYIDIYNYILEKLTEKSDTED